MVAHYTIVLYKAFVVENSIFSYMRVGVYNYLVMYYGSFSYRTSGRNNGKRAYYSGVRPFVLTDQSKSLFLNRADLICPTATRKSVSGFTKSGKRDWSPNRG